MGPIASPKNILVAVTVIFVLFILAFIFLFSTSMLVEINGKIFLDPEGGNTKGGECGQFHLPEICENGKCTMIFVDQQTCLDQYKPLHNKNATIVGYYETHSWSDIPDCEVSQMGCHYYETGIVPLMLSTE